MSKDDRVSPELVKAGRLSLRGEGHMWNAYYALPATMEGALFLGSVRLGAADLPARRAQFLDLMRDLVADLIHESTGLRPTWGGEERAPEHERGGNG